MTDKYRDFKSLKKGEVEGIDYAIQTFKSCADILIMAPHGGEIEPYTSDITRWIATDEFSYYSFEGAKENLHITSHKFDEPRALQMVQKALVVLAIHGEKSKNKKIYVGGKDEKLRDKLIINLNAQGFDTGLPESRLAGTNKMNICNRGKREMGVQMEISKGLREELSSDVELQEKFVKSVKDVLRKHLCTCLNK